jgi:hypothetical protein
MIEDIDEEIPVCRKEQTAAKDLQDQSPLPGNRQSLKRPAFRLPHLCPQEGADQDKQGSAQKHAVKQDIQGSITGQRPQHKAKEPPDRGGGNDSDIVFSIFHRVKIL